MNEEQMHNELMYQTTMSVFRRMLREGLISRTEYRKLDGVFLEKYHPMIGTTAHDNP